MSINNPQIADRVRETSVATAQGTGTITLTNVAVPGYQTFASQFIAANNPVQYCIVDPQSNLWEIGVGIFVLSTFGLQRTAGFVYSSSSGAGQLVNFTNGSLDVFNTVNAQNAVTYELRTGGSTNRLRLNPPLNSSGNSGYIELLTTQATAGNSAPVTITPAAAPTTYAGNAGYVTITSGKGGWTGAGGAVTVTAGAGGDSGTVASAGGAVTVTAGAGGVIAGVGANGGAVTVAGGANTDTSTATAGGAVTVRGGNASAGGNGGALTLVGGAGSALSGVGGAVNITPGAGNIAGGGTNGTLTLKSNATANPNVITIKDDGSTGAQLGFFTATPIVRPTTAITGTAPVTNSGTTVNTGTTFEGYTLAQVVTALKTLGLLT